MFESGEWIWHEKYGRGNVATSSGPVTYVLWDDMSKNDHVETAPPTDVDENANEIVVGPSELIGHYVYIDEAAIQFAHEQSLKRKAVPAKQGGEQPFMFFPPGWFKVTRVDPKLIPIWSDDEQRWKMRPLKGQFVLSMTDVSGIGEDKVRNFVTKEAAFYVPARYATDTLYSIMEDSFGQESEGLEDQEDNDQE